MLPNVNEVEFYTTIPSTKQKIKYRPFTVKQQKALLFARESGETMDIINAVCNVLQEVVVDQIKVRELASFDIEYLFLQIRGKSIGENVEFKLKHFHNPECNKSNELMMNIDDIQVTFPDGQDNKIQLNDQYGVVLKYPTLEALDNIDLTDNIESNLKFISNSIEMVYDNDKVYDDFNSAEAYEFLMTLSPTQFQKIVRFYQNLPFVSTTITYTCKHCNQEDTIRFKGLADFFMLG